MHLKKSGRLKHILCMHVLMCVCVTPINPTQTEGEDDAPPMKRQRTDAYANHIWDETAQSHYENNGSAESLLDDDCEMKEDFVPSVCIEASQETLELNLTRRVKHEQVG